MGSITGLSSARSQRGVALLIVLWACTLLAILLGGYAALARTEGLQVRNQVAQIQAHYAAEAGVMRAIHDIQASRQVKPQAGRVAVERIDNGRPSDFRLDAFTVRVTVTDEAGKIDINSASPTILQGLFVAAGLDVASAQTLAANIADWRNPLATDSAGTRQRYAQAGLDHGPRHAPFASLEELQAVLGMDPALYEKVAPAITIWSHRESPAVFHAPALALAALPGMDLARAREYVALRDKTPANAAPPQLPTGLSAGGTMGTSAKTILAEGRTADGTRAAIRVTVRFERPQPQVNATRPAFTILQWQDEVGS
jgi:general secretion pathway protein K